MTTDNAQNLTHTRTPFHEAKGEAVLQIVLDYWEQLRRGSRIPLRQDIAPSALDHALPHCFIAERVAPEVARFRVAGQALRDILDMDARGMPVSTFLSQQARDTLGPVIETAFSSPRVVEIALQTQRGITRPTVHARLLIMPLRDDENRMTRHFGALVTDRPVRLGNRRFQLAADHIIQNRLLRVSTGEVRLVATADDTSDYGGPNYDDQDHDAQNYAPSSVLPNPPRALRLVVDNT